MQEVIYCVSSESIIYILCVMPKLKKPRFSAFILADKEKRGALNNRW
jgi:hypothetical protein